MTQVTFGLPHSREQETESDRIGLELMARAGYHPNAAVTLWQKNESAERGAIRIFLSTHPSSNNHITDLQANLPKVLPLYHTATKP
jgi:predicted Zn-dependent protease